MKAPIAVELVSEEYRRGDRWLIYCSDIDHIREIHDAIRPLGIPTVEYHSLNTPDHDAAVDYFVERGGLMLAVKCLDEGSTFR